MNVKSSILTFSTSSLKVTLTAKFLTCIPDPSTATVAVGFLVSTLILAEAIAESVLPIVSVIVFAEFGKTSKEYVVLEFVSMSLLGVRDTAKYCPDIVDELVVLEPVDVLNASSKASTFVIDDRLVLVFDKTNRKSPISTLLTLFTK